MLHASLCSRELGVCLGTAAWEGARGHGAVLASAPHVHGALRTDVDALHPFWGPAAVTPSVPNAWMWSPCREHPPPLGHRVPAVTVPKLSPRLLSPRLRVPDPLALPDKDPSVGDGARQRGAGGAGLGRVPPNTNQEGGAAGSVRGETPPQLGKGGSGRGKRGPAAAPGNKESVWLVTALRKRGETNAPLIGGEVTAQETLPGGRPGGCGCTRALPQRFPPLPRSPLSYLPLGPPSSRCCVGHLPRAPSSLLWVHGLDMTFLKLLRRRV